MRPSLHRLLPLAGALTFLAPTWAVAQNPVTINGRVQSEDGAPLAYADVSIPSLGVGAVTRDDGRYAIFIPGARVTGQSVQMTARRLGYKVQTVTVQLKPRNSATSVTTCRLSRSSAVTSPTWSRRSPPRRRTCR